MSDGVRSWIENPWVIALTVTLATFIEVLDTSIANVALPHIGGNLSATPEESTWVLTSYLVANAVVLPLSGWLSGMLGRKRFNMICVTIFTLSSALCGMAPTLSMLVLFRVIQGLGGGGLQPTVQAILVDTFPAAQRGMAMAVYTVAILIAPVMGPTLGGWITDNYSWRWIFYINVPVGALSLFLTSIVLKDPPYLVEQLKARAGKPFRIDYIGLSLISIGLATLEILLDKGQEEDWFSSKLIICLAVTACVSLVSAVIWELRHPEPILNLRLFGERNFLLCSIVCFAVYATLFASTVLLPQLLQGLMGYSATQAGMVLSPAGLVTMLEMPIIGYMLTKGADARYLIVFGLSIVAFSSKWLSGIDLTVTASHVIWPRVVQVMGSAMMFVPINTIAYRFIPKDQTNNASGLFSLVRNEGSSIGVAAVTTLLARHVQVHQSHLVERITPLKPMAVEAIARATALLGPGAPEGAGLIFVRGAVARQAAILAYLDMFRLFGLLILMVIPLVFLMKKGGPPAADAMAAH